MNKGFNHPTSIIQPSVLSQEQGGFSNEFFGILFRLFFGDFCVPEMASNGFALKIICKWIRRFVRA